MNIRPNPALRAVWLAGVLGLCPGVQAQTAEPEETLDLDGISFVSGGIGSEESEVLKAQASQYALALTFAQHLDGEDVYLASVPVTITNAQGSTVLDVVTDGPYLLVNLPAGRYRVEAQYRQVTRTAEVEVTAGASTRRTFLWQGRPDVAAITAPPRATVAPAVSVPAPVAAIDVAAAARSALPAEQTWQGVRYLTGGIGSDESAAIKAEAASHTLSVTLAARRDGKDVFVADVPVVIRDAQGRTVLEVTTEGPYLLADLEPGSYEVSATYAGEEKRGRAQIAAGKSARVVFLWQ